MIIRADARTMPLRAETVQCVVTSPPYWGSPHETEFKVR
jgi:tRNA G10  N-methylase Trm11